MKKEEPKTDFNFSYADLGQLGDKADDLMNRDAVELELYGVDAAYRANVAAQTEALKNYPTDEELKGDAAEATEQKEQAADAVKVQIRGIMVRVKQVFKPGTATYKGFGTSGLDDLSANDLVRCGKRVSRLATEHMLALSSKGITPAVIGELDLITDVLDNAIDTQDAANRARNEGTQERVEMANTLYAVIVELFDFGKDYWITRNEAKYNDYIIYNTPGGGASPPVPTEITGTVAPMSTANVASGMSPTADVSVTNTGTAVFVVCTTNTETDPCTKGITVSPGETSTLGGAASLGALNPFLNITNNDPVNEAAYSVNISS